MVSSVFILVVLVGTATFHWTVTGMPVAALGFGLMALGALVDLIRIRRDRRAPEGQLEYKAAQHPSTTVLFWTRNSLMVIGLVMIVTAFWIS
jgi:hypothetical protein